MVWPAAPTRSTPWRTVSADCEIKALISLAAVADRCASERTSLATTAKPLPCSPARAASTAAFNARILVWKAMPSITEVMSEICADALDRCSIVSITACMVWLPCRAASIAWPAMSPASWASWALRLTAPVSSSMDSAVWRSARASSLVRADRSALPCANCTLTTDTASACWRTPPTTEARLRCMPARVARMLLASPCLTAIGLARSPALTVCAIRLSVAGSAPRARVMRRAINQARPAPSRIAAPVSASINCWKSTPTRRAISLWSFIRRSSRSIMRLIAASHCTNRGRA